MNNLVLGIVFGASVSSSYKSIFQSTDKNIAKLGDSITKTNAKFKSTKNLIKYKSQLDLLKKKQSEAGGSSNKLAQTIKKVENRYQRAEKKAKSYGIQIGSVVQAHNKLGRSLAKLENRQKRFKGMAQAKEGLGALKGKFLGLIGGAYAAGRVGGQAIDHEQATIRLATVVDKASFQKAKDFAREYSQTHLTNETEIVNIQYALNSAGLGAQASMIGAEIVEKVAKVTSGSAEGVGEVIGVVFNNMASSLEGNTKDKLTRIGDLLTKTQLKFQIRDFGQLGESFAKGAKGAVKYKVALDQTATILGQLNTAGIQGSLAGTSFNAILRQMGKSAEDLGFAIKRDAKGNMDMIKTIENLNEAMADTTDIDERAAIIQDAFGDEGGAISLLLDNLDNLKKNYADVKNNADGVVSDNYAKFMHSTGGQMAIFGNNIRMIGTAFSESLFPAINTVLKPVTELTKWVTNGIREYPVMAQIIGGVAVGIGVYAAGLGIATVAQWAMNAAMVANPIGLVVAGLVVGATMVYKYWEPISDFFVGIWNGIKSTFGSFVASFLQGIRTITAIIPNSILPDGFSKSIDKSIVKYQSLGKTIRETKTVIPKLTDGISVGDAIKRQAKAFGISDKTKANIKAKAQQAKTAVAATALATNIAVANTPKIQQTTVKVPQIIIQASANPVETGKAVQQAIISVGQQDSISIDEQAVL